MITTRGESHSCVHRSKVPSTYKNHPAMLEMINDWLHFYYCIRSRATLHIPRSIIIPSSCVYIRTYTPCRTRVHVLTMTTAIYDDQDQGPEGPHNFHFPHSTLSHPSQLSQSQFNTSFLSYNNINTSDLVIISCGTSCTLKS